MLQTPAHFTSLLARQAHASPASFIFCGDELLVGQDDLALPSAEATIGDG